jgi:exopolysaccharide production protein ExoQ
MRHDTPPNGLSWQRLAAIAAIARRPWFATFVLVFLTAAFLLTQHSFLRFERGFDAPAEEKLALTASGDILRRVGFSLIGVLGCLCRLRERYACRPSSRLLVGLLLVFVCWVGLSVAWSDDISFAFRRLSAFALICAAAYGLGRGFRPVAIRNWLVGSTAFYLTVGVVVEIIHGDFHPLVSGYRFAGTMHPNAQGINCGLLLLSLSRNQYEGWSWMRRAATITALLFLLLTRSRTAFGAVVAATLISRFATLRPLARLRVILAAGTLVSAVLLFTATGALDVVKAGLLLGRSTETSRAPLWSECLRYVARSPLLGAGYDCFWTPEHVEAVSTSQDWGVSEAHSAPLELLLGVGVVGLALFLWILLLGLYMAFRQGEACSWWLGVLVFAAVDCINESQLVCPSYLMLVVAVILTQLCYVRVSHVKEVPL